ncbi:MAG: PilZ domain-containing protein [Deltaproteobacteria bacterium]|nr:PilZ domain-containing protein [Deltaproteobacteria bacterium]
MEFRSQIQGETALAVFQQLQRQRIPLRIHVLGRGYERLSIVTGVEFRNGGTFLLLDLPVRFETELPDCEGLRVQLEFADRERIPHSCRTVIHGSKGDDLWLFLPDHIERIQRRKHFRVEPPQGTRIVYPLQGKNVEFPVLNLSLGGGLIISPMKGGAKSLCFEPGMTLRGVRLLSTMEEEKLELEIRIAEVIRAEKITESSRAHFALQFVRMEREDEQMLDRFIYYSQRRLLKKRSLLLGA